jgi:hypothetical protein
LSIGINKKGSEDPVFYRAVFLTELLFLITAGRLDLGFLISGLTLLTGGLSALRTEFASDLVVAAYDGAMIVAREMKRATITALMIAPDRPSHSGEFCHQDR